MAKDWHVIPLYGVALQQARASGDVEAMETVARRAEQEAASDPEIQKGLADLRAEIGRLRGGGSTLRPLYASALQQARASGEVQQMRELAERARSEASSDPEIQSALADLESEIARHRS